MTELEQPYRNRRHCRQGVTKPARSLKWRWAGVYSRPVAGVAGVATPFVWAQGVANVAGFVRGVNLILISLFELNGDSHCRARRRRWQRRHSV